MLYKIPSLNPISLLQFVGDHGDISELVEYLDPLLHEYGVDAYYCGHDHISEHLTYVHIVFIIYAFT